MNPQTQIYSKSQKKPVAKENSKPYTQITHLPQKQQHLKQIHSQTVNDHRHTQINRRRGRQAPLRLRQKSLYRNTAVAGCDFYAPAQFVVGTRADIAKSKWNIILNKEKLI